MHTIILYYDKDIFELNTIKVEEFFQFFNNKILLHLKLKESKSIQKNTTIQI